VIWGVLTDTKLGEPLLEAQVSVVGTRYKAITDIDGRFRLELPPGTYNLRFFYELHEPARLNGVQVAAGELEKITLQLTPDENSVDVVEVETEADRTALEGQILSRQRSASVGDGIGRAEISKTPDSNAAQAAQRVVGATIVGGRFVYVRGLGERYSNALLNGAPLPSPEPDRAAVPLDLFPAQAIQGITINKTFVPHLPGDFAGGSIGIETREIPTEFLFNVQLSGGYNSDATFRDRLSYRGSSMDWLGLDSGTRSKPGNLPDRLLSPTSPKPGGGNYTEADLTALGRSMNSYMSATTAFTPPNHGLSLVVGNGWRLGPKQRLGAMASLSYGRTYEVVEDGIIREFRSPENRRDSIAPRLAYRSDRGLDMVRWGALGSVSYEPHPDHQLMLLGFHSQLADNTTQTWEGDLFEEGTRAHATRLSFVARSLDLVQLSGEHKFPDLANAQLKWFGSLGLARRDEPDTRDVVYNYRADLDRWAYYGSVDSGRHFWSEQNERSTVAGMDWTQPLSKDESTKLMFGALANLKKRDFEARRFVFEDAAPGDPNPLKYCAGSALPGNCPDKLFLPENIGSLLALREQTRGSDAYQAKLDVLAAYIEADVGLTRDLRLILGERVERTVQTVDPVNQFEAGNFVENQRAELESTDLLPSLSLVYNATDKTKFRAALTRTLARPQVRELAPFAYSDYFSGRENGGNPELELTRITNADLRFEYFPTLREVAAFSIFYKNFADPIEPVIVPPNIGTFTNTEGANLIGAELEGRKHLDFISERLRDFSVIANLTVAHSRIQVGEQGETPLTNTSRPLSQQAPFVLNLMLDYTNDTSGTGVRVLYNVTGPRIVEVGTRGLDDVYEQPRHLVDLTLSQDFAKHFQAKLTARNVLNAPVRWSHGEDGEAEKVTREFKTGAIYTASLAYTY
jgi:outer membrane receptor protein involved in Fe transport